MQKKMLFLSPYYRFFSNNTDKFKLWTDQTSLEDSVAAVFFTENMSEDKEYVTYSVSHLKFLLWYISFSHYYFYYILLPLAVPPNVLNLCVICLYIYFNHSHDLVPVIKILLVWIKGVTCS